MVLCALAEVLFDIDRGHETVGVHPPGLFSEQELNDIAFNAFPDSLSQELRVTSSVRDSCFSFRLRRRAPPPGAPAQLPWVYGHVFCRQRHDERLRRGCEQKAVVLLSWLPLHSVLQPLARRVGPAVLAYGPAALRQVLDEVQRWPPLEWGCRMELPLLGMESLHVQLPLLTSLPSSALPAAVAAGLGHYAVAAAMVPPDHQVAGRAAPAGDDSLPPGSDGTAAERYCDSQVVAPLEDAAAAGAAAAAAANGSAVSNARDLPVPPHLLVATPAQVAMALADELDGSGLPVGVLPQAAGQVEPEASVFGDCDCFTPLRGALGALWTLWELLLLGEPLLVVSPTPGACSSAVAALLSLLAPFPYSLDWRPYYTIHDPTFARLASGELPTPSNGLPVLMGVTNMYFLKALQDWPNVLATGHTAATVLPSSTDRLDELAGGWGGGGGAPNLHASESSSGLSTSSACSSSNNTRAGGSAGLGGGGGGGGAASRLGRLLLRRAPASPSALLSEPMDHCWLTYKPHSRPDKTLLERLVQPQATDPADKWRRLAAVNSAMLRRHFQELTKALLAPLLPYITPRLPPPPASQQGAADPKAPPPEPPTLPRLDADALLAKLSSKDSQLPELLLQRFGGQRGLLAFYQRFLRSPNLVAFMHLRRLAAAEWQRQEWEAAGAAAAAPMQELLTVEAFFHLGQQLTAARQQLATARAACSSGSDRDGEEPRGGSESAGALAAAALAEQLQQQLHLAFSDLPEDLQTAIMATPSHAVLLSCEQRGAAAAPM